MAFLFSTLVSVLIFLAVINPADACGEGRGPDEETQATFTPSRPTPPTKAATVMPTAVEAFETLGYITVRAVVDPGKATIWNTLAAWTANQAKLRVQNQTLIDNTQ